MSNEMESIEKKEDLDAQLIIKGGNSLNGTIKVSGAKNAVLPIMAASILGESFSVFDEVPFLEDVKTMGEVLKSLGLTVERQEDETLLIDSSKIKNCDAPYDLVRRMRASVLVMGPLLARFGETKISLPGGCAIGTRPIDLHLKGFEALGAKIEVGHGYVKAMTTNGLKGTKIYLDFPSVGATENIMMAAVLAKGQTILENAAKEPEIVDLANYLNTMGASVRGAGTSIIKIEGVNNLKGSNYTIIPDRVQVGTYMVAAAMTGGNLRLENALIEHLQPVVAKLREAGVTVEEDVYGVNVVSDGFLKPIDVKTLPYPGFPTDMQAQFMSLASLAKGDSVITETVFENRFMHVDELKRMGANIRIEGRSALIKGVDKLSGCPVKATDLRAGAALVLAALAAEGETQIGYIYHIERGYDRFVEKLSAVGADIKRSKNTD